MSQLSITLIFLAIAVWMCNVQAQNDGRYRPVTTTTRRPTVGRYNPGQNSGRYIAGNDGKYRGSDDGRYRPSDSGKYNANDGRYIHQDNPYKHSDNPYTGDSGAYKPDKNQSGSKGTGGKTTGGGAGGGGVSGSLLPPSTPGVVRTTSPAPRANLPPGNGTSIGRNGFKILYLYDKEEKDGYHYIYETENGILAEEEGHIVPLPLGEGLRSVGFFQYTGDDGLLYRVDYKADDAGFVPTGAHLPKTPAYVVKLVEFLKEKANKKR